MRLAARRAAKAVAVTVSVAITATVMAVPSPIMKVAAIPAQKMPCASANTSTRIAPEHGRRPDRDDRGQAALPAAGTGKLIRRRPVRMAAVLVVHMARLAVRRIAVRVAVMVMA